MARLDPPIEDGDKRWDAVEFRDVNRKGRTELWCAYYTPRNKNGEWSKNKKRVWSRDTFVGATSDVEPIPQRVIHAGLKALRAGISIQIDRLWAQDLAAAEEIARLEESA